MKAFKHEDVTPIRMMKWVKLKRYCEISGDTADAVDARKRRGKWLQGIHWQKRSGAIWINLEEVSLWVESGLDPSRVA